MIIVNQWCNWCMTLFLSQLIYDLQYQSSNQGELIRLNQLSPWFDFIIKDSTWYLLTKCVLQTNHNKKSVDVILTTYFQCGFFYHILGVFWPNVVVLTRCFDLILSEICALHFWIKLKQYIRKMKSRPGEFIINTYIASWLHVHNFLRFIFILSLSLF